MPNRVIFVKRTARASVSPLNPEAKSRTAGSVKISPAATIIVHTTANKLIKLLVNLFPDSQPCSATIRLYMGIYPGDKPVPMMPNIILGIVSDTRKKSLIWEAP